jgi:hypothetical protein
MSELIWSMLLRFLYLTQWNNNKITSNLSPNRKLTCHVLARSSGNICSDEWQTSVPQALVIPTADLKITEYRKWIYMFKIILQWNRKFLPYEKRLQKKRYL